MGAYLRAALPLLAAVFLMGSTADGQGSTSLTNDHPIVIDHLIGLYTALASQIATHNATDPANAASRQMGAQESSV